MSFSTGQISSVLKIVKAIPIHKNQSRVHYANYKSKIVEKLMYKRLPNFLDVNNLL